MHTKSETKEPKLAVRSGTAKRRAGKETSAKIVRAARELLTQENYSKFSMRSVAKLAGINLRNLQYYFPTAEDLINALFLDLVASYRASFEACIADAGPTPLERFEAVIRFEMQDIMCRETRKFFLQLWVLVGSLDNYKGGMLDKLFSLHSQLLAERIKELDPSASTQEIKFRSKLLDGVLEGLMVVLASDKEDTKEAQKFMEYAFNQCIAIAQGDK